MIRALGIISGVVSAVQLATDTGKKRDEITAAMAEDRRLMRRQYEAIMRARRLRKAGKLAEADRARDQVSTINRQRLPLLKKTYAMWQEYHGLNAALAEATAKLSAPALEETPS